MPGHGAMAGLNGVVRTLTGPIRLRSALRRKTAPITRLLVALDAPCELRATIPAAVFGGDIFGVMSRQLRESLIVQPATAPTISRPHRQHSLPLLENPFAKHSEDVFPPLADRVKPSTPPSHTTKSSLVRATAFRNSEMLSSEPAGSGAYSSSENQHPLRVLAGALETPALSRLQTIPIETSWKARTAPTTTALVTSLNRYWQQSREMNNTARAKEQLAASERPNVSRNPTTQEVEPPNASVWPRSLAPDAFTSRTFVSERRAPFNETTSSAPGRPLSSAPPSSFAEPEFKFHPAPNGASHYDDLGDRLAQILHEQALQHGIDVT